MAKARDQKFFTDILYGGEASAGGLRLESTTSPTKGVVQVVGTSLDVIINNQTGRFVHANTALRTYTLPDVSGTVLVSGVFTTANQFIYSTGAGTFTVLPQALAAVLTTSAGGVPTWLTGVENDFLQIIGGVPILAQLPSTIGTIAPSVGNTLPVYQSPGPSNALVPLSTVNDRTLISPSGVLTWGLLTASYLSASGGVALGNGVLGQKLKAVGDGTFVWVNDPAVINPGTQFRLAFYSAVSPGSEVDDSGYLESNEGSKALGLRNNGSIRFFEDLISGIDYVEFKAASTLAGTTTWILPAQDGSANAVLQTDGSGNLSFVVPADNGSVANALAQQVAFYSVNGNDVSGLATVSNRILLSPSGSLAWQLLTAPYLAALGNTPLGNGVLNQVLISNADSTFNWVNAESLVGKVNAGTLNAATFYASAGTQVSASTFFDIVDASKRLDIKDNGIVRFYEAAVNGSDYVELRAAAALAGTTSYVLPIVDGTFEQALVTDGAGNLSFITVGRGTVNTGTADTLAYYAAANNSVASFTNVASRVMTTTALNAISWSLLTEEYLSTTGNIPLTGGVSGQVLISDGASAFSWVNASTLVGAVQSGVSGYLAFYPTSGNQVNDSSFLLTVDASAELHLRNSGKIRLYEITNTNYVGFTVSAAQTTSITWTLPLTDAASSGDVLTSNAAGILSFQSQVDVGAVNAVAFYQAATRRVSPAANAYYTGTGLTFTGSSFDLLGTDGASPTTLTVKAGNGAGVNGADLVLLSGDSDSAGYGAVHLGVGSNYLFRIEDLNPGQYLSALNGVALRFYDDGGLGYVGFKAPSVVATSTIWNLPDDDGIANQALITDGSGNLGWASVPAGVGISAGTLNAFAFYSTPTNISSTQLLIPVGLPGINGTSVTVDTFGQISYAMLVTPGALPGAIGYYSLGQTINYVSWFNLNVGGQALELGDQAALRFYEDTANGTNFAGFQAPVAIATSYTVTLPDAEPLKDQFVAASSPTALKFSYGDLASTRQKRGIIPVANGTSSVFVVFDEPFATKPRNIKTMWSIESATSPCTLPTMGVLNSSEEGFTVKFSTTTTQSYSIYWEAYLDADDTLTARAFFGGGDDAGVLSTDIYGMNLNVETSLAGAFTMSSARAYMVGSSSIASGYVLGGQVLAASTTLISSFNYSTSTVADLVAPLATARSGAAAVGNRSFGYAAGGETIGVGSLLTIAKLNHTTEVATPLAGPLSSAALKSGSATSATTGYIVHSNATSTVSKFTYATETLSAGGTIGVTNIQVGCNNVSGDTGYFGRSTGALYSYAYSTDTSTLLTATLSSTAGLSSAANSITNGYFGGDTDLDRLNFDLETVSAVASWLPVTTGWTATSVSSFQTRGLL